MMPSSSCDSTSEKVMRPESPIREEVFSNALRIETEAEFAEHLLGEIDNLNNLPKIDKNSKSSSESVKNENKKIKYKLVASVFAHMQELVVA